MPDPTDEQLLDPRYVPQQRMVGRLVALGLALASLLVLLVVFAAAEDVTVVGRAGMATAWLGFAGLLAWHAEAWPAREYAHARYRLDEDGLHIRRGVWWRTATHVPRSRIQHTDVSQGPMERSYGLGTLIVYTAGTSHARVALPGLSHEVAVALRDELRVDQGRGRDDSV